MTKQNCTSGIRTTKEKRVSFTLPCWVWGSCLFYKEISQQKPTSPTPIKAQRLPLPLPILGGHHHV